MNKIRLKQWLLFPLLFITLAAMREDKPAYRIYAKDGGRTSYEAMLESAKKADIVLFGELHDNPVCHWLELELTKDMYRADSTGLKLGAEMIEADNQVALDEYLKGLYGEATFKDNARLWPNYGTDYRPLVEFAKAHHLPFAASNVPRRYAAMVSGKGFDFLNAHISAEAKTFIAPLPIPYDSSLKCYKDMLSMGDPSHSSKHLPEAQALKDATMAYRILQALGTMHGTQMLHFNGAYHSNNYQGIYWYLKQYRPGVKIITISTVEQSDMEKLEKDNAGQADFTICVEEEE